MKIGKAFSTSLHLWFCIRILIALVISNLCSNTSNPTIVLVLENADKHDRSLHYFVPFLSFPENPSRLRRGSVNNDGTTVICN